MPSPRCVVQGCSNRSNPQDGISLHDSPVNKNLAAKWKNFVRLHRKNFDPEGRFVVSEHCLESHFPRTCHLKGALRRLLPGSVPTNWKSLRESRGNHE